MLRGLVPPRPRQASTSPRRGLDRFGGPGHARAWQHRAVTSTEFELSDRLGVQQGAVAMSGVQALIRVPVDQRRADRARGLHTAGLIAGYRGSPLAGVDDVCEQNHQVLAAHDIRFISGVNEDLAATMVWGSQQACLEESSSYDGVIGLWYGKGPGIDRSLDALRHANLSGVGRHGGVLAAVGDDPACKSSTLPSASEGVLADLGMPVVYPGSVQDVVDLGRWVYELSRYSGLWVGCKIHTDVADQYGTVEIDPDRLGPLVIPDDGDWTPMHIATMMPQNTIGLEADAFGPRIDAVHRFVGANGLDTTVGAHDARLGIIAAGKSYADLRSALRMVGLEDEPAIADARIRILKPAVIWPLEPSGLWSFARGLDEILVIEEKRPLVERQARDLLFDQDSRPRVTGKRGPGGAPLVPGDGAHTPDRLIAPLLERLEAVVPKARVRRPRERIAVIDPDAGLPDRTPYFCSGCPHNRSTVVPEGSVAGGGIGCHAMATWMDRRTEGMTHMGGEGAQWVGMEPFVADHHRFQNVGDGTFFHSGSLALRQAVSAGSNTTFRILYNGTVAMTGGQDAAGNLEIPELTQLLHAEGVVRTVVVTDEPTKYGADPHLAPTARIEHRASYDAVLQELRDIEGVTAVIYDQRCAAELRRDRRRGRLETPTKRIFINEAVCDGCGDCGRVSNCMSVHPVETPFGRKTRIHQESCNYDYSCVDGNCPAFLTVEVDPVHAADGDRLALPDAPLPPDPDLPEEATILVVGIGGTGVVTVSQILSTAAIFDGKHSVSLDQTGLAQKGGQVISNLRITTEPRATAARIGAGETDTLLVFDVVGATNPEVLVRGRASRTTAVVSTVRLPTGTMVRQLGHDFPELERFRQAIETVTRAEDNVWFDAEGIARAVFGSQPAANLIVVGVAHQRGLIPVSASAIESAIVQNGVAVEMNLEAFRLGRRLAADASLLASLQGAGSAGGDEPPPLSGPAAALAGRVDGSDRLAELVRWRVPELIAYADQAYARRYVEVLERCRAAEEHAGVDSSLTEIVAFQLFKLMAYKDEYEVARLHLREGLAEEIRTRFGPGATYSYMLDPPILERLDRGKMAIGERVARPMFATLARMKRLRGTRLDPFGNTEERRIERELVDEYPALIDRVLARLSADNADQARAILALADQIRGFDTVKLANVARYREEVRSALADYEAGITR